MPRDAITLPLQIEMITIRSGNHGKKDAGMDVISSWKWKIYNLLVIQLYG